MKILVMIPVPGGACNVREESPPTKSAIRQHADAGRQDCEIFTHPAAAEWATRPKRPRRTQSWRMLAARRLQEPASHDLLQQHRGEKPPSQAGRHVLANSAGQPIRQRASHILPKLSKQENGRCAPDSVTSFTVDQQRQAQAPLYARHAAASEVRRQGKAPHRLS